MRNQGNALLVGGVVAAIVALPVVWYLVSPLFITRAVDEPLPAAVGTGAMSMAEMMTVTPATVDTQMQATEAAAMVSTVDASMAATLDSAMAATQDRMAMEATAGMETAMAAPTKMMEEPMPTGMPAEPTVLAKGNFYHVVHEGQGTATIYALPDGPRVLRLDEFMVLNGPDLHVYLAPVDPVPYQVGLEIEGAVDLGKLKGNVGSQNYTLSADLDLSLYKSVVIWCQPFRVPFIAAALK